MKHNNNWTSVERQKEEWVDHDLTETTTAAEPEDTINYSDDFNFLSIHLIIFPNNLKDF